MKTAAHTPRATYRVQLHADFNFVQLAQIVPYLHELGISDVYLSPIFLASPGSQHGYDVCDHNVINPELGGMDELLKVGTLLKERGMGMVVDFVPNHMGIEGAANWRWMDVLEEGPLSSYGPFFDIEWNPRQSSLQDRIIIPVLGDFYGRVLECGGIKIEYQGDAFWAVCGTLRFPLRPESYGPILLRFAWLKNPGAPTSKQLEKLGEQFKSLPQPASLDAEKEVAERRALRDSLRLELATLIREENLAEDLAVTLKAINGDPADRDSFDTLHQILEDQNYRLAYWKTGTHEINYRRFFAVDTLVGLRMESQQVFEESHRLLKELIGKGIVQGVRIDHIDGLLDPAEYLERLAGLADNGYAPIYALVEKILTEKEELPQTWMTHGTTGYDFTGDLVNLLIATRSESEFTRIYSEFAGISINPHEQAYRIKLYIMDELFPNALDNFALDLEARVKTDRRWRDWTVSELRPALSRIIACLSVYRTYRIPGQPILPSDADVIERAVAEALKLNSACDPMPYHFIRDLWIGRYPDAKAGDELKAWAEKWVCKLQQYTGAIMAKSIEDTFFYRYVRLYAANEVGHHPAEFGRSIADFHEANLKRQQHWPAAMLGTSTHDTKMSEDVRARLFSLSEIPEQWDTALHRWSKLNHGAKTMVNNLLAPDANEEYLIYQILLGAWPLADDGVDDEFCARMKDYIRKALSEAKVHTNWSSPNEAWVKACEKFIDTLIDKKASRAFWEEFTPLQTHLAEQGMKMSLIQTALKLTVPGVPDFYQGTEIWDFSLVDPDNRRPVDYGERRELLDDLDNASIKDMIANWKDGRIKMHLIRALLAHRGKYPDLFLQGNYTPLNFAGPQADRFVAFQRQHGDDRLLVVALRRLERDNITGLEEIAQATSVNLPEGPSFWRELITGRDIRIDGLDAPITALLDDAMPVAIFVR